MFRSKKTLSLIIFLLVLITILVIINLVRKPTTTPPQASLPPIIQFTPKDLNQAPKNSDDSINLNSPEINESESEIAKISDKLPFNETYVSSTGAQVTIMIPSKEYQDSEWTLTVLITGIDYQVPPEDEANSKKAFLEATQKVFSWLRSQGVNPEKIYIIWGDKKFIQDKATLWLKP